MNSYIIPEVGTMVKFHNKFRKSGRPLTGQVQTLSMFGNRFKARKNWTLDGDKVFGVVVTKVKRRRCSPCCYEDKRWFDFTDVEIVEVCGA